MRSLLKLSQFAFACSMLIQAGAALAQPTSSEAPAPIAIDYTCHVSPASTVSGQLTSTCLPPSLPYRDAFRCYFSSDFQAESGNADVGVSVLLPEAAFRPGYSTKEVCVASVGSGYVGTDSGPLPFNSGSYSLGHALGSKLTINNCANWLKVGKPFSVISYSAFNSSDSVQASDGLSCDLVIRLVR